jgi:hypothetical protein
LAPLPPSHCHSVTHQSRQSPRAAAIA